MPLEDLGQMGEFWLACARDRRQQYRKRRERSMARAITNKPSVIIAHTIPGKAWTMEYDYHWHGAPPNSEQAKTALKELRTLAGKIME